MAKKYNALTQVKTSSTNETWTTVRNDTDLEAVLDEWNSLYASVAPLVTARFVAVHAGGYRGVFAKKLSDLYTLVYTFEPDPLNFHCLVTNNQSDNVIKLQAALSNDHALVNVVNPNVDVEYTGNGDYPSLRVDDLNLQACNLLIFDVGGYEYKALLGSTQTLLKHSPVVAVKNASNLDTDIEQFLGNQGYTEEAEDAGYSIYIKS